MLLGTQELKYYAEKNDNGNVIIGISTVVVFIVGIFCGLLSYHCIRLLLIRRAATRPSVRETQLSKMHAQKEETELYVEVNTAARYKAPHPTPNTHVELKENIAYGNVQY